MTVSTMTNKEWASLTRAFDRPDLLEDPRFKTPQLRDKNVNERLDVVQHVLRTRTTQAWLEIFEREDVPCAPALSRQQVIEHPQVLASEILQENLHPVAGSLRQTRVAARFEGSPPDLPKGAPRLGEHNHEVLCEMGLSEPEIEYLITQGAVGNEQYNNS